MLEGIETIALSSPGGSLRAEFAPSAGMVCCSLRHRDDELLAPRAGLQAYYERGSTMGIPLLHPWANRLAGRSYGPSGAAVSLPRDSPLIKFDEHGLPIHGVLPRLLDWELSAAPEGAGRAGLHAHMSWERPELLAVFPYPHEIELHALIEDHALRIQTTLRATANAAVPVAFGYHPYLTLPGSPRSGWRVELPPGQRLALDGRLIPTGAAEPFAGASFALAGTAWDTPFAGLEPGATYSVSDERLRIELELTRGYPCAQVFSPAAAEFICFEPMTAPGNSLLSRSGLTLAAAGEEFRAAFRIAVTPLR